MILSPSGKDLGNRSKTTGFDVSENVSSDADLLSLLLERQGQGYSQGVSDSSGYQLLESDAGLDHPVRRHARFGHAKVQGNIWSCRSESVVRLDDLVRVGVFEGYAVTKEPEIVQQLAMFQSRSEHGTDGITLGEFGFVFGVYGAAVDSDANGAVIFLGYVGEIGDLFRNRKVPFVVVKVSRIVTNFLDVRGYLLGESIVLLQVDAEWGRRLLADLGQRFHIFTAVYGDANQVGASRLQQFHLAHGRGDVLSAGSRHALHGDRVIRADRRTAYPDLSGRVPHTSHFVGDGG